MTETDMVVTPCKHCGAPIEQRRGRGRPKEYCPDGDCQAAAKRERELRRATPGLEGALARAEQLYERMETGLSAAIEPLARALADELSPAGGRGADQCRSGRGAHPGGHRAYREGAGVRAGAAGP
ncbi:hypothetical protein ACFSTC_27245 [Nonomuraea ferruginea]